jgi:uncharacterized surface protein with fasciclin (FAS1) repeats
MKSFIYILEAIFLLIVAGCRDQQWDEHGKKTVEGLNMYLLQDIQANPDAANFYKALITTGYDQLLASGNSFTVLVPENKAWADVDMTDKEALSRIVANHIVYGKKLQSDQSLYESLLLANGKILNYSVMQSFNGAQITTYDHVAGNGVFHFTDKLVEWKANIWEYIKAQNFKQPAFIKSLDYQIMDIEKSPQTGVDPTGKPVYDTARVVVNDFLNRVPINDESRILTYILLQDEGFDALHEKYAPYFKMKTSAQTDSVVSFNICQDFVFEGIIDIANADTLTNLYGMKVPVKGVKVVDSYYASNGKIYVIDRSSVLLREKIRPIVIEGEDYNATNLNAWLIKRYRTWASGTYDMVFNYSATQRDTIRDEFGQPLQAVRWNRPNHNPPQLPSDTLKGINYDNSTILASNNYIKFLDKYEDIRHADSVRTTNFGSKDTNVIPGSIRISHGYVEYKPQVNSVKYEIHYVAYDDVADHIPDANRAYKFFQKLFVSMPGEKLLIREEGGSNLIKNNYLGDLTCFVTQDTAGIFKERKMRKWELTNTWNYFYRNTTAYKPAANPPHPAAVGELRVSENQTAIQFIKSPVQGPDAEILEVPWSGELTMWLTNTAYNPTNTSDQFWQGWLFMDYIKLVPVLPEE